VRLDCEMIRIYNFKVCPEVTGMRRFTDIFLLPGETGSCVLLTFKGLFEKNIRESIKTAASLKMTSDFIF